MYEGTRHIIIGRATVPAGTESIQSYETACNSTLYRTDAEQRVEVHALVKEDAAGLTIIEQAHIHFDASKVRDDFTNRVFNCSSRHVDEYAPGEHIESRSKRAIYAFQIERFLEDLTDFEPTVEFAFMSHAYLWEGELKATPVVAVAEIARTECRAATKCDRVIAEDDGTYSCYNDRLPCAARFDRVVPDDDCFGHDGSAPGPVRSIGSRMGLL